MDGRARGRPTSARERPYRHWAGLAPASAWARRGRWRRGSCAPRGLPDGAQTSRPAARKEA
eukprot:7625214-Alexandrium_andersonii.AAC.1